MGEAERAAIVRWDCQHGVFMFYGNGGVVQGEVVDRWYEALLAAGALRLYVTGAGNELRVEPEARKRATELFKRNKIPFAMITENPIHRMLGTTARMIGINLQLYA